MYRGEYQEGYGVMRFGQGDYYFGMWFDGFRTVGKHIFEQGDIYIGEFNEDNFEGYGFYQGVNRITYIGGWKGGK